jgi:hypothetical protein
LEYLLALNEKGHSLNQLEVTRSKATLVSTIKFSDTGTGLQGSWIYEGTIIISFRPTRPSEDNVGFWNYPAGGSPTKTFRPYGAFAQSVVISPGS